VKQASRIASSEASPAYRVGLLARLARVGFGAAAMSDLARSLDTHPSSEHSCQEQFNRSVCASIVLFVQRIINDSRHGEPSG
jgi:hypothetical protein